MHAVLQPAEIGWIFIHECIALIEFYNVAKWQSDRLTRYFAMSIEALKTRQFRMMPIACAIANAISTLKTRRDLADTLIKPWLDAAAVIQSPRRETF